MNTSKSLTCQTHTRQGNVVWTFNQSRISNPIKSFFTLNHRSTLSETLLISNDARLINLGCIFINCWWGGIHGRRPIMVVGKVIRPKKLNFGINLGPTYDHNCLACRFISITLWKFYCNYWPNHVGWLRQRKTHKLLTELDDLVEYLLVQLIIRRNPNEINCTFKLFMNILNSIWEKKILVLC